MRARHRVAITGIGVIAPGGIGTKAFWNLLTDGRTATRTISAFDASPFRSRVAAECDFTPAEHGLSEDQITRCDRATQFALAAADAAVADSGLVLDHLDPGRLGVVLGTAVGATTSLEQQYAAASCGGRRWLVDHTRTVANLYDHLVPASFAAEVARQVAAEGPVAVISTGCTSGLDAVGHAMALIREGSAGVVLAGATDCPISPITVACFDAIRATSPDNHDPAHASRPFDATRNGFVLGEGAAVLVLEEWQTALSRGARIYAELAGFASRSNAWHMTGLRQPARELAAAATAALDDAGAGPHTVDYVNAHGSGTQQNDRHETDAIKRSLGSSAHRTPVSSIKSMIGHSLGAIGSIELAACALAIAEGVIPPTANLMHPDPECDLDYVPVTAREGRFSTVLSMGSGFGGFQSAAVLTAPRSRVL